MEYLKPYVDEFITDKTPPFVTEKTFSVADFQQRVDWGLESNGILDLHQKSKGEGVLVFILDTGIDKNHSDLQGNIVGGVFAEMSWRWDALKCLSREVIH